MPVQLLLMPRHAGRAMVRGGMLVRFGEGGNPNLKLTERYSLFFIILGGFPTAMGKLPQGMSVASRVRGELDAD